MQLYMLLGAGSAVDKLPEIRGFIGIGYVFGVMASILFGCASARRFEKPSATSCTNALSAYLEHVYNYT